MTKQSFHHLPLPVLELGLIHNTLHSGDSFVFLFLNSRAAPGGGTIPDLSICTWLCFCWSPALQKPVGCCCGAVVL